MLNRRLLQCSLAACLALAASVSTASAQSDRASLVKRLDSLAGSGVMENRAAGIVAAVVKGNDTLLLKGYGKADVEWNLPMPADAMFEIGSITKQFTAVAILQLRDEGKLSLDDEITKWLPDFDMRGNKVTIRRLLDHTSGIKGITEMPEFGILVSNPRFPRDSAYALIKRYPFEFKTGEAQIYNNSAFWLLGLVVEKASGGTYEDYVEKKLFAPLGMTRSMYCNSAENVERAIRSIDEEVAALARDGVTDKELAESSQYLVGSMPRSLETNAGIAQFLQTAEFFGLGLDYDVRLPGLIRAVTREQIRALAARYLSPDRAAVVVAGPYEDGEAVD